MKIKFYNIWSKIIFAGLCLLFSASSAAGQKLDAEEVLAKHLESIGTAEARAAVSSRIIQGKAQAQLAQSSISTIVGTAALTSDKERSMMQMSFETDDPAGYKREQIIFDGKNVTVDFITESRRSALGSFIFNYREILKEGLFGGTLFSSWALLDAKKIGKIKYDGKDKIEGKEAHVLRYVPRGGSSLTIKLFFDAQNFRHLRSEYSRIITPSAVISAEVSPRQSETRHRFIEDFSDYKTISGLNLPTSYKITYQNETETTGREFQWRLNLSRFAFNQQLKQDTFNSK